MPYYAVVDAHGNLDQTRSKGFAAVKKTGAGNYCLTLRKAVRVDPSKRAWSVTVEHGTISDGELRVAYASPQTCPGRDLGVRTARLKDGRVEPFDSAFSVVLP